MNNTKYLKGNQSGTINVLLVPLILVTVLLLAISVFALITFNSRQQYKNETDKIVATQVDIAVKETSTKKDNEFAEKEKQPLKNYQGPDAYGALIIRYPKTWSGYVDDSSNGSVPVNGYFYPTTVPGFQSGTAYALRVQVVGRSFSEETRSYDNQVKSGKAKATSYSNKNIPGVVGMRVEGESEPKKQGIVVMLPLRDKTVKLYTESDQFYKDFNDNILPNFSFTP